MNRQIRQLGFVLVALFFILFAQLNYTQVVRASDLQNDPLNNRKAVRDFSTPRGTIQTADGTIIANSIPVDDKYKQQRQYPTGDLFGHTTGFFSFNYGNEGIERTYNDDLAGKTYALKNIGDLLTDRVRSNNVTVSLTNKLQQTSRDQLGDRKGAVVALDPKTGAILSMWSNPSYDPTVFASHDFREATQGRAKLINDPNKPTQARAYRESYAPGSTFKVITAAAAYERQPALTTQRFPVDVRMPLPNSNQSLGNFGGQRCGGALPELLRVSCNTGFARIGIALGPRLSEEAQDFGFNQDVPIDMPFPARSRFPSTDTLQRNQPSRAYSAIGQQNVSATPLEMAMTAGAIANDGVIMEPTVMKEVRDSRGDIVRKANYKPWRRATTPDAARNVRNLMVNVAERGTAVGARIPGVQVAGKTGTAETGEGKLHAWLISFAPANDPKVAVAVILENQPGTDDTTGGRLAAPIAQQVMRTALGM